MVIPEDLANAMHSIGKEIDSPGTKTYASLLIRRIKGGIEYKLYYEMIGKSKFSKEPAYVKLIFPTKKEIIFTSLDQIKKYISETNKLALLRYEFEDKKEGLPKYMYVFILETKTNNHIYFDLSEKLAKEWSNKYKLEIQNQ